jgi:hypothetical protein
MSSVNDWIVFGGRVPTTAAFRQWGMGMRVSYDKLLLDTQKHRYHQAVELVEALEANREQFIEESRRKSVCDNCNIMFGKRAKKSKRVAKKSKRVAKKSKRSARK